MDRTLVLALIGVLGILVGGFVALGLSGVPTTDYLLFLGGPIVTTLVGLVLTKRTAVLQATTDVVVHQTNDMLTKRLDTIDQSQAAATVERSHLLDIAVAGTLEQPRKLDTRM